MIYRYIYACYGSESPAFHDIAGSKVATMTLSQFGSLYFLYYETTEEGLSPAEVLSGNMIPFPDGSLFFRMPDVFHYSAPRDEAHWARRAVGKKPLVRLNRLRYDKYSSYIFQHYRFEEEYPADGDKYGIIAAFQNMIYFYCEEPMERDTEPPAPTLTTRDTPLATWNELMSTHFLPWEDFAGEWRELPCILHR